MRKIISSIFLAYVLGACVTTSPPSANYMGSWQLRMIGDRPAVPSPHPPTLTLDSAGHANGNGGCNAFGGQYVFQRDTLSFSHMIGTQMACASASGGDEVMTQERAMGSILNGTVRETVVGDALTLSALDGRTLRFARVAAQ